MNDILNQIRPSIARTLQVDEGKITLDADIRNDLLGDSLDTIEIVMLFEEEFMIRISDNDADAARTIGDLVKLVERARR